MCKAAERLLRLYMATTALNAGNFKQLLARKVHVHKYGGLSCNFLTFFGRKQMEMAKFELRLLFDGRKNYR